MKAKFVNESINILRPKSDDEILDNLKNLSADDLLIKSSEIGFIKGVKLAIKNRADVHTNNDYALRWASDQGHTEVIKVLLDAGANVHVNNDYALSRASEYGNTEIVKVLLDVGADVHADNDGALRWASYNGHIEVVKILLNAGADVTSKILFSILERNNIDMMKLLLNNGGHKFVDTNNTKWAIYAGVPEIIETLKKYKK